MGKPKELFPPRNYGKGILSKTLLEDKANLESSSTFFLKLFRHSTYKYYKHTHKMYGR